MLGLCICYYNHNYGSMLQAFATVKYIEKLGLQYEIIKYHKKVSINLLFSCFEKLHNKIWWSEKSLRIQKKIKGIFNNSYKQHLALRTQKFNEFSLKIISDKNIDIYSYKALCKNVKRYNAVLVGSDQMWSPSGLTTNFYNLMFVPENIKKISYAASFGVSKIPRSQYKRTRQYLNRIEYLSVREESGAKIIKDLTNREAFIAVDPTMLLSAYEWDMFSGMEKYLDEPYIFAYFLGNNAWQRQLANKLREETGYKIVTLRHLDQYIKEDESFGDIAPYDIGPKGFVNLIKNAEFVLTDSFHGSVFSVLFHKQFLTFYRYSSDHGASKNSRIDSLLSRLKLFDRRCKLGDSIDKIFAKINYDEVEVRLTKLIQESKQFLNKALLE